MASAFNTEKIVDLTIDSNIPAKVHFEIFELSNGRADIFYKVAGAGWSKTMVSPNKGDVDQNSSEISSDILKDVEVIALTIQVRPHYQTEKYRFVSWVEQNNLKIEGSSIELKGTGSSTGFVYMLVKYQIKHGATA